MGYGLGCVDQNIKLLPPSSSEYFKEEPKSMCALAVIWGNRLSLVPFFLLLILPYLKLLFLILSQFNYN